jgi:hypothetical protein
MFLSSATRSFGCAARLLATGCIALVVASCGGGGGSPGNGPRGPSAPSAASVSLIFSSPEIKSDGAPGSEVTVTALVKTRENTALAAVPVQFSASSGSLAVADAVSDANGQVKAVLTTSGDRSNRTITITALASGAPATTGTINVVGTTVTAVGPTAITSGGAGEFTITVRDSANAAVSGVPVSYTSQRGNPVSVRTSGGGTAAAPLTNAQGQVVFSLTASQSGADTLTFSAQGASSAVTVGVTSSTLVVRAVNQGGATVTEANTTTSCQRLTARYEINRVPQNGSINITTSRGNVYSDASCNNLLVSSSVPVVAGDAQASYVKSDTAGIATITASIPNGPSAQTSLEFVAGLTQSATISLQADPAVIGVNSGTGTSEMSTLTAIVRDGTTNNNLVKNAVVEFSLVSDKSGGRLSNPSVVTTATNGSASVTFIAGTADTETDGVVVQARIQGTNRTATASLTVSRKSLFIRAGTGNLVETPSSTTYKKDFAVFVTDASGNPVSNVSVTAAVIPTQYRKGGYAFDSDPDTPASGWFMVAPIYLCENEDGNRNGILDAGEDFNNNGTLDPGIPLSVTSSGRTDTTGTATVSILYPRDRSNWTEVRLTIRGSASGTESTYQTTFTLPALASDFSSESVSPPGHPNPYGINPCSLAN